MSLFRNIMKALSEAAAERAPAPSASPGPAPGPVDQDGTFRYAGVVEGAQGIVDLHVLRIVNAYQNVFRISGTIRTPAGQWGLDADGLSGWGKLHDESIIFLQVDEQDLAITINPGRGQPPTYRFRRV